MKKLLIVVLFCLSLISCNNTWYSQGHVNSKNTGTFIVNDTIKIVNVSAAVHVNDDNVIDSVFVTYIVIVNDEPLMNTLSIHNTTDLKTSFTKEIVNKIQKLYYEVKDKPIEEIEPVEPIEEKKSTIETDRFV